MNLRYHFQKNTSILLCRNYLLGYSVYICELSTVRASYQQNSYCFDEGGLGIDFNV